MCFVFVFFLQPVPEELQNGAGFGYVVAFRPRGATGWMQAAVPSAEASRYVFKNESIQPFSPFHVKVGVYNNEGEGPFGPVATIYSAEEGVYDLSHSASCSSSTCPEYMNSYIHVVKSGSSDLAVYVPEVADVFPRLASHCCLDKSKSF